MPMRIYIILLLSALYIGCSKPYKSLNPGSIIAGEVTFQGLDNQPVTTKFFYSVPLEYDCKQPYPLLVALHGGGDNAAAFHDLWKPVTDSLGYVLLTPQGDCRMEDNIGWTWGANAEQEVLTILDGLCKDIHIDKRRIYLAGFSAGGRMAYQLGFRYAPLFRGVTALSASYDTTQIPGNMIKKPRFYIAHGALETEIAEQSSLIVEQCRSLGLTVRYVQYENAGHGLPEPLTDELRRIIQFLDSGL